MFGARKVHGIDRNICARWRRHQSDREQQTAEAYENISFAFSAGPAPPRAIMSGWVAYMGAGGRARASGVIPLHAPHAESTRNHLA